MKQGFWRSALALAVLAGLGAGAHSQTQTRASTPKPAPIGMPQDWSSTANLFVAPITPEEAAAVGQARATYVERLARDPRYVLALAKRFDADAAAAGKPGKRTASADRRRGHGGEDPAAPAYDDHRDWSNVLGGTTGGSGSPGTFPAKFNFDVGAAPSCANDYVTYTTRAAGATNSGVRREERGDFSGNDTSGTVTIGSGARAITLTASTTDNTGLNFLVASGNSVAVNNAKRDNLIAAIKRWTHQTGIDAEVDASANGRLRMVSINAGSDDLVSSTTGGGAGFGGFSTVSVAGSGTRGQPTIVAFNNLYKGTCGTANAWYAPSVYWSYNTGTGRITETSPVISYYPVGATPSGGQVAFVQRRTDTSPDRLELVLLKWATGLGNGSVGAPATPASVVPADYRTCTAPCMTVIEFNGVSDTDGASAVTHSSPFVDYSADVLWVGDGAGKLRRFANVFRSGTPAETVGNGYPVTVVAGNSNKLSPPVYDFAGNVWIGSASQTGGVGGRLHKVSAALPTTGVLASSAKLSVDTDNPGLRGWPQVDRSGGRAYVYVYNDGSTACSGGEPCQVVVQLPTATASLNNSAGNKAIVGRSVTNSSNFALYAGAFDNAVLSNTARNGFLYVCGSSVPDSRVKMMWRVPVTGGMLGTPVPGPEISAAGTDGKSCSPVFGVLNGTSEYFYTSIPADVNTAGCTGACLLSYQVVADANETWEFQFTGANGNTDGAGNIVINGVSLDPNTNNTGDNFNISGTAAQDAASLAAKITAYVPGFSATSAGNSVFITATGIGDYPAITEDVSNFGQTANVNGAFTLQAPKTALPVFGGTGGFVIDNFGALPGTSQIYFSHLAAPGNAVQVSQSNLD